MLPQSVITAPIGAPGLPHLIEALSMLQPAGEPAVAAQPRPPHAVLGR